MDDLDHDETVREGGVDWPFTSYEAECVNEVEQSLGLEAQLVAQREAYNHRVWVLFQNSACSVAQLYKDRMDGSSLWLPFQVAASNVTNLYKESQESQKSLNELTFQTGVNRRNRDLLQWLKKKKRKHIRRDDLLAFLCGKKSSHHPFNARTPNSWSVAQSSSEHRVPPLPRSPFVTNLSCLSLSDSTDHPLGQSPGDPDQDLQPFRDAIALSAATRPSATITSTGLTRRVQGSRTFFQGTNSGHGVASSKEELEALNSFISEEFHRNIDSKKRPFQSMDVVMSSPTHKKPRY